MMFASRNSQPSGWNFFAKFLYIFYTFLFLASKNPRKTVGFVRRRRDSNSLQSSRIRKKSRFFVGFFRLIKNLFVYFRTISILFLYFFQAVIVFHKLLSLGILHTLDGVNVVLFGSPYGCPSVPFPDGLKVDSQSYHLRS